jgi:hypothetical protein
MTHSDAQALIKTNDGIKRKEVYQHEIPHRDFFDSLEHWLDDRFRGAR